MKSHVLVFVVIVACLLALSSISCTQTIYEIDGRQYSSASDALAVQKQKADASVSQIAPAKTPIGGSIVVIIPTDEVLAKIWKPDFTPTREQTDWAVQSGRIYLLSMVQALRKTGLFDEVEWRQSPDPEQESFGEDFALILPNIKKPDWSLRTRRQIGQTAIPIQMGALSLSSFQRMTIWLSSIEEAARKAQQQ